jgi:hypothetical protein
MSRLTESHITAAQQLLATILGIHESAVKISTSGGNIDFYYLLPEERHQQNGFITSTINNIVSTYNLCLKPQLGMAVPDAIEMDEVCFVRINADGSPYNHLTTTNGAKDPIVKIQWWIEPDILIPMVAAMATLAQDERILSEMEATGRAIQAGDTPDVQLSSLWSEFVDTLDFNGL